MKTSIRKSGFAGKGVIAAAMLILILASANDLAAQWQPAEGLRPAKGLKITSMITGSVLTPTPPKKYVALAGTEGGVFLSMNGGLNWEQTALGDNAQITSMIVTGTGRIFAGVKDSSYATSTNGGQSWIAGGLTAIATTTAGKTWPKNRSLNNTTETIYAFATGKFKAAERLYAATQTGVYYSTDDGESWAQSNTAPLNNRFAYALAVDSVSGDVYAGSSTNFEGDQIAVPNGGGVWRSIDGGENWNNIGGVGQTIYALLASGKSLYAASLDDGLRVIDISKPNGAALPTTLGKRPIRSLTQDATGALYAASLSGVYRSTTQGITWEAFNDGQPPEIVECYSIVYDPVFDRLYLGEERGGQYFTSSGSYASIGVSGFIEINGIAEGEDYAVAVGDSGRILRAQGKGLDYIPVLSPTDKELTDADIATEPANSPQTKTTGAQGSLGTNGFGSAVAVGVGGTILRSADGGNTWSTVSPIPTTESLLSVAFVQAAATAKAATAQGINGFGSAVAVGVGGTILRSADGGASWALAGEGVTTSTLNVVGSTGVVAAARTERSSNARKGNGVQAAFGVLIAAGEMGAIVRSENDGQDWASAPSAVIGTRNLIEIVTDTTLSVIVIASDGEVFLSSDAGASWNSATSAVVQNTTRADRFELSQNYPNPFNPATTISYQLSMNSEVKLKVYDVLGREVATLVNERQAAGSYRAFFNAKALASGIYFYRLSASGNAGTSVQTKKMMLVK
ncbi:MAG: T9SS type A sorting domain-containing protein [Rhizobacter sp.]|nr:T9SS type A sorting domain-containing protein [Chlorobiales bacterium]